jgi:hypothetical protein
MRTNKPQQTIDDVEDMLKKHEAFEKSAAAQEERFTALERPTTVSTRLCTIKFLNAFSENAVLKRSMSCDIHESLPA